MELDLKPKLELEVERPLWEQETMLVGVGSFPPLVQLSAIDFL